MPKAKIKKNTQKATVAEAPVTTEAPQAPVISEWIVRHLRDESSHYSDVLNERILAHLVEFKLIGTGQAGLIQAAHHDEGANIIDIITDKNILAEQDLGSAVADFFSSNFIVLKGLKINPETLQLIPEAVATSEGVIAYREDDSNVHLAMANPGDRHFLHLVEKKCGKKAIVAYTTPHQVREALKLYRQDLNEGIDHLVARAGENIAYLESLESISSIFDTLVLMAFNREASDIHVEPFENGVRIRFRIDGVLHNVASLPKRFLETIINHVKVLSKLRTDEHNAAQDGRFKITYEGTTINFRVSILPTYDGEKIVLRLLTSETQELSLEELGYEQHDRDLIEKNLHKSHGMVLVTGPTGSGKTTTLYSLLKQLNVEAVNISTIEDPIEYGLYGVNQIQVNPKTNLNYADGLKSLLRQDPDILMIGEIRDLETGHISGHAALTGHLVFSTLHTNNAPLGPLRLIQMGLDPYLIVSTLNLIIAQRLVRKICPGCIKSVVMGAKELMEFKEKLLMNKTEQKTFDEYFMKGKKDMRLFRGSGCKKCAETGYRGRIVIAETMQMKENIRKLIMQQASEEDIRRAASENGMTGMLEDGFKKVISGVTTLDELFRVLNQ